MVWLNGGNAERRHGDRWGGAISRAIRRRLERRGDRIAALLQIDSDDNEWQPEYGEAPGGRDVEAYIAWRKSPPIRRHLVGRLDLALDQIEGALREALAYLRDANRAGSLAAVRRKLEVVAQDGARFSKHETWWKLSPRVRFQIETEDREIMWAAERGEIEPLKIAAAASAALKRLPEPGRGRPPWSENLATDVLGYRLAMIFAEYTGTNPTRRYYEYRATEYGPFRDFVETVLSMIPLRLRRTRNRRVQPSDHFIRRALELKRTERRPGQPSPPNKTP